MKLEDAAKYTEKCFNGELASCSSACPFGMDIRSFLQKAAKGKWGAAYKELRAAAVFPAAAAALCEVFCASRCQRTDIGDDAVDVCEIERAVMKYAKNKKAEAYSIPPKEEKIAVVGAGISGLAAALCLAQKKYNVTVFEKESTWGGSLRSEPCFEEINADFELQFSAVSVEFRYNTEVLNLDMLDGFDAVYIASGKNGSDFGLLASWDSALLNTVMPHVYMGGALCGSGELHISTMDAIAQGKAVSKTIEIYLKTGAADRVAAEELKACDRRISHAGVESAAKIVPSSAEGYTEEEAKTEASRCMQCDCAACLSTCEMLTRYRKKPRKMAVEVFADSQVTPPISSHTITRQVYSCNDCGHCKAVCPENSDIGTLLMMSRADRLSTNSHPAALHDHWLREMDFYSSKAAFAFAPKTGQTDKALSYDKCDYAFFPGCRLGAVNPEYVFKSYGFLKKEYKAGIINTCCGAPAYWAGDKARFDANAGRLRQEWNNIGNPTLVYACATCKRMLAMMIPEANLISLYELIAEDSSLIPAAAFKEAAVFDPCAARGDTAIQSAVRKILHKAEAELEELSDPNRCCGYGGHMSIANPSLYDKITENRISQSEKPYIVYCVNCGEVFKSKSKEFAHILDIVYKLEQPVKSKSTDEKRANSLNIKKELLKKELGMDFEPEKHEWDDITLKINDTVQAEMDNKLISASDVREAIWTAEQDGEFFIDETEEVRVCSNVKSALTYWVWYKQVSDTAYEVINAYYHRMKIKV